MDFPLDDSDPAAGAPAATPVGAEKEAREEVCGRQQRKDYKLLGLRGGGGPGWQRKDKTTDACQRGEPSLTECLIMFHRNFSKEIFQ